jgi:rare lipoprotein A
LRQTKSLCWLGIFILFTFLSGCSSTSHLTADGPPHFYVDETKIPDPVPRLEPFSKYGNMSSYVVFGKRYYPLRDYRGFEQEGVASWYGTKFHAHRTSSGEPYSMLTMTAAHKTLPLPCYVEVTNLKNHRKVIVRVNDRGPFSGDRIIDLSYVAAKKLDMLGHGTTHVRIRAIDPSEYNHNRPLFFTANKHQIYLQVGAFKSRDNAYRLKDKLARELKTRVNVDTPTFKGSLYIVRVGPIEDLNLVDGLTSRLNQLGFKPNRSGN